MDEIRIENLKVFAHHGVYEEETREGQNFFINATLYTDTRKAGLEDDLELSTNYGDVCHFISEFMIKNTYQLLEAVAENLSRKILETYPLIKSLDLEIRKPEAPIGLPFESVSVKIHRGWHTVYVAVGSNMGDKRKHIESGMEQLRLKMGIKILGESSLIETIPYGGVEQEKFLNGAIKLETYLSPYELLDVLHQIEASEERERKIHWGPRTLDLDILFYDDLVMDEEDLCIPHVDLQNREFVLIPMMELAPSKRHPILKKSVQEMLAQLRK